MRVLFVSSPGPGVSHTFPVVPAAWACRAAGHEVLLATGRYGGYEDKLAGTGLDVVDAAPGIDFARTPDLILAEHAHLAQRQADQAGATEYAIRLFAAFSRDMVDGVVEAARRWRPDLVVHTPLDGAGPVAARVLGVPTVLHEMTLVTPFAMSRAVYDEMGDTAGRFGVAAGPPTVTLSVVPPSMRIVHAAGWSMRNIPYNGGAVLPDWLLAPIDRPRVVLTIGMSLPRARGSRALLPLLTEVGDVNAEFVLLLGGVDAAELGRLPANVRTTQWVPLSALLAVSDAIVHHGGGGTMLTSLDSGVPQIVVPHAADHFLNADAVARRGIGLRASASELDAELVGSVLGSAAMRAAAREVAEEMRSLPSPATLVPALAALAAEHTPTAEHALA